MQPCCRSVDILELHARHITRRRSATVSTGHAWLKPIFCIVTPNNHHATCCQLQFDIPPGASVRTLLKLNTPQHNGSSLGKSTTRATTAANPRSPLTQPWIKIMCTLNDCRLPLATLHCCKTWKRHLKPPDWRTTRLSIILTLAPFNVTDCATRGVCMRRSAGLMCSIPRRTSQTLLLIPRGRQPRSGDPTDLAHDLKSLFAPVPCGTALKRCWPEDDGACTGPYVSGFTLHFLRTSGTMYWAVPAKLFCSSSMWQHQPQSTSLNSPHVAVSI